MFGDNLEILYTCSYIIVSCKFYLFKQLNYIYNIFTSDDFSAKSLNLRLQFNFFGLILDLSENITKRAHEKLTLL